MSLQTTQMTLRLRFIIKGGGENKISTSEIGNFNIFDMTDPHRLMQPCLCLPGGLEKFETARDRGHGPPSSPSSPPPVWAHCQADGAALHGDNSELMEHLCKAEVKTRLQTTAAQSHWSIKCRSAWVFSLSSSPTNNHYLNPPKDFKNLHLPLSAQEERLQFIGCNPGCARRCFAAMLVVGKFCEELQETIKGCRHHRRHHCCHSGSLETFQGLFETLLQRCCVGRTETY